MNVDMVLAFMKPTFWGERPIANMQRRDRKDHPEKETQGETSDEKKKQPRMLLFPEDSCRSLMAGVYHWSHLGGCGN